MSKVPWPSSSNVHLSSPLLLPFLDLSIYHLHISTHTSVPACFSPHSTWYTCQVNTMRSSPDGLYLHVPVCKPSVNKSNVHFHNCRSYDGPLFSTSRNSFCPNSIMFQTKAKNTSFSWRISTWPDLTILACLFAWPVEIWTNYRARIYRLVP